MIALLLSVAHAQTVALSYEEALGRAADRNQGLRQAEADVSAGEARLLAARGAFDPSLAASGTWFSDQQEGYAQNFGSAFYSDAGGWNAEASVSEWLPTGTSGSVTFRTSNDRYLYRLTDLDLEFDSDPTFNTTLSLGLTQSLLQGARMAYNLRGVRAAASALTVAEAQARAARQTTLADTATAYWNLHYLQALVAIAEGTTALQREQQRVVAALVEAGKLAAVEGTRIDAAVAQADRALLDARNAAAGAEDQLAALIGGTLGERYELTTPLAEAPAGALDPGPVVEAVLAGSPELAVLRAARDEAAAGWKDARHGLLPDLSVTGGVSLYGFDYSVGGALGNLGSLDYRGLSVGANLTVPLGNRADRGAVGEAQAALVKAESQVTDLEQQLAVQVRAQLRNIESAREAVRLSELNVTLAEQTLAVEQARLTEGRSLQKDVIQAVKDLDAARVEAQNARAQYQLALLALERMKGGL